MTRRVSLWVLGVLVNTDRNDRRSGLFSSLFLVCVALTLVFLLSVSQHVSSGSAFDSSLQRVRCFPAGSGWRILVFIGWFLGFLCGYAFGSGSGSGLVVVWFPRRVSGVSSTCGCWYSGGDPVTILHHSLSTVSASHGCSRSTGAGSCA